MHIYIFNLVVVKNWNVFFFNPAEYLYSISLATLYQMLKLKTEEFSYNIPFTPFLFMNLRQFCLSSTFTGFVDRHT